MAWNIFFLIWNHYFLALQTNCKLQLVQYSFITKIELWQTIVSSATVTFSGLQTCQHQIHHYRVLMVLSHAFLKMEPHITCKTIQYLLIVQVSKLSADVVINQQSETVLYMYQQQVICIALYTCMDINTCYHTSNMHTTFKFCVIVTYI